MIVFHRFPQTVPHTRNKDSYPDLLHTSLDFLDYLAGTVHAALEVLAPQGIAWEE
jgi:hypothetical protein